MNELYDSEVTTTCGYCGVGCRLETHVADGKVVSISPALDGPANGATPASRAGSPTSSRSAAIA